MLASQKATLVSLDMPRVLSPSFRNSAIITPQKQSVYQEIYESVDTAFRPGFETGNF
jgi:hypothetical protein